MNRPFFVLRPRDDPFRSRAGTTVPSFKLKGRELKNLLRRGFLERDLRGSRVATAAADFSARSLRKLGSRAFGMVCRVG